jgi:hypothetical protein
MLLEDLRLCARGGHVDVGANYSPENNLSRARPPAKAIVRLLEAGIPLARILLSSDGNGAPPKEEQREASLRRRTTCLFPPCTRPGAA